MPNGLTKRVIVALLAHEFGEPAKTLKKIVAWRIRPGLDVVMQLDSRQANDQIYLWVPAHENGITAIDGPCDLYAADKSRHANVANFESLALGRWAIRFRPKTEDDVVSIVRMLRRPARS